MTKSNQYEAISELVVPPESEFEVEATPLQTAGQLRAKAIEQTAEQLKDAGLEALYNRVLESVAVYHDRVPGYAEVEEQLSSLISRLDDAWNAYFEDDTAEDQSIQARAQVSNEAVNWLFELGCVLLADDSYSEALDVFNAIIAMNGAISECWSNAGVCAHALEAPALAAELFSTAAALDQIDVDNVLSEAQCRILADQLTEARTAIEEAERRMAEMDSSSAATGQRLESLKNIIGGLINE